MQSAAEIEQLLREQGASLQLTVVQEHPCLVRADVVTAAGDKRSFYSGGATLEMARGVAALNAYQAVLGSDEQFARLEREVAQSVPPAVNVNVRRRKASPNDLDALCTNVLMHAANADAVWWGAHVSALGRPLLTAS